MKVGIFYKKVLLVSYSYTQVLMYIYGTQILHRADKLIENFFVEETQKHRPAAVRQSSLSAARVGSSERHPNLLLPETLVPTGELDHF